MIRRESAPAGLHVLTRYALVIAAWLGVSFAAERAWAVTATDTLVKYDTAFGAFYIDLFNNLDSALFPSDSPNTVQNFLNYVDANSYQNSFVHRLTTLGNGDGISVVQGGGFTYTTNYATIPKVGTVNSVSGTVNLEYSRANSKGTIAMARTGDPNSANSEWFINYLDDSAALAPKTGSAGYAVFGQVVGTGLTVVNSMTTLPFPPFTSFTNIPSDVRGALGALPVRNYTQSDYTNGTTPTANNLVMINNISVVGTHPAFQNPMGLVAGSEQFRFDVNNDAKITALDALTIVNFLNGHTAAQDDLSQFVFQQGLTGSTSSASTGDAYLDVNGSGKVEALDVLQIVNYLNSQPAQSAALTAPMALAAASVVVPEPGTITLTMLGLLPLAAWSVRRRMRRAGKTMNCD